MLERRLRRSTRAAAQATASHVRRMILLRSTPLNTSSLVPNEPPKNYDFEQSATADCCLNVWATAIQPLAPFLYNQGGVSAYPAPATIKISANIGRPALPIWLAIANAAPDIIRCISVRVSRL